LLEEAPYEARRRVLNLCANGEDNVGEGPGRARDGALAAGVTVNALALGDRTGLGSYLRERVQGGPASFVLEARTHGNFAEGMLRKFLTDLIARVPGSARGAQGKRVLDLSLRVAQPAVAASADARSDPARRNG
jgi:Ca-activated chloride channel homolog